MTSVGRLILVSHAMTNAVAAARFPADEPLNDLGRRQVEAIAGQCDRAGRQLRGPERRAEQTARLLGLGAAAEPLLADLDCGRWRGRTLQEVPPDELAVWLADPAAAPHGGESIAELTERVAAWLGSVATAGPGRTVAVTHPAVIRAAIVAALGAPADAFWRIDIRPVSRTALHYRDRRWTLRL
ncbi:MULTISPECIES: histidine phosphatase family protein [unclassified Mycobacterium]|uniref:histidine phosphatase family protein n=1 Tax=unclassified Mycobacterium TaxID=2642494 RepID=UPI0007FCB341|nr:MULTISPECIES: histidine phosphatase family protein [unclassified Mycobacterium]OBG73171.1 histidine phosphatase [Mycobacterium sp. E1214]OBH26316.1 histidine phosphatase [Mycobacterium sp. E1319]